MKNSMPCLVCLNGETLRSQAAALSSAGPTRSFEVMCLTQLQLHKDIKQTLEKDIRYCCSLFSTCSCVFYMTTYSIVRMLLVSNCAMYIILSHCCCCCCCCCCCYYYYITIIILLSSSLSLLLLWNCYHHHHYYYHHHNYPGCRLNLLVAGVSCHSACNLP